MGSKKTGSRVPEDVRVAMRAEWRKLRMFHGRIDRQSDAAPLLRVTQQMVSKLELGKPFGLDVRDAIEEATGVPWRTAQRRYHEGAYEKFLLGTEDAFKAEAARRLSGVVGKAVGEARSALLQDDAVSALKGDDAAARPAVKRHTAR